MANSYRKLRWTVGALLAVAVVAAVGPATGEGHGGGEVHEARAVHEVHEVHAVGPAPTVVRITWMPERPIQGHLFRVRVAPDAGDAPFAVAGIVAGEPLHFEPAGNGAWESLAAVPIEVEDSLPVRLTVSRADGSSDLLEASVPVEPGDYRHERLSVAPEFGRPPDPETAARLERDREKAAEVARQAHRTPRIWTDEVVLPRTSRVTSGFGNGRIFNDQISGRHMGLDLEGAPGDTVLAAARGVVELVDDFVYAGNIVYLNHGGGLLSGYFHLSEQLVQEGDTVAPGTPIGRVGATGRVTGPHLHWVVRYGTTSVDPRSLPALVGRLRTLPLPSASSPRREPRPSGFRRGVL